MNRDSKRANELYRMTWDALGVAFDQALEAGWPLEKISIENEGPCCVRLCIESLAGCRPWPVFEVRATFDLDNPIGPSVNIIETWMTSMPKPDPVIGAMRYDDGRIR